MILRSLGYIAAVLLGTTAQAQDVTFSPDATETCLAGAASFADSEACVGASAKACIAPFEQSSDVDSIVACLNGEEAYWESRLASAFDAALIIAAADDADNTSRGISTPSIVEALTARQDAWTAYRDSACNYETVRVWGGLASGPIGGACRLDMTGKQALSLEAAST